jgi:hypothetical protein
MAATKEDVKKEILFLLNRNRDIDLPENWEFCKWADLLMIRRTLRVIERKRITR